MASRSDTELLTEHFGYPPVSLLDEIINSVNFLAERALASIEQGLLNAPPASLGFRPDSNAKKQQQAKAKQKKKGLNGTEQDGDEDKDEQEVDYAQLHRDEVEAGVHQLETLLWASIDKNFDRFEIYVMRNIFGLWKGQELMGTAAEIRTQGEEEEEEEGRRKMTIPWGSDPARGIESINHLRRRLQASKRLQAMLVAERARNAALLAEMKRLLGVVATTPSEPEVEQNNDNNKPAPFRFLRNKTPLSSTDASAPLTTTTAFALSQLPALRDLSSDLRKALPKLAAPVPDEEDELDSGDGKKKSWRVERLEYVETAARRHLEKVRGLELTEDGEVKDGQDVLVGGEMGSKGLGRLEKEQVEGLEKVVGMLGRKTGSVRRQDGSSGEGEDVDEGGGGDRMDES
ncbi:uncharacterized protein CTHT_0069930 [Thermochaetoides thermophila DSM 1495]|uniref:Kinetochore-associated protein MTW1 n=1 Tax=Chaetomium thermophilum (strain DSM 1495 / CBS 144.50 / IMI 039719) TaxID=759272 RepID=G0SHG4_CHATD|nr:hypothetical protein CTHT_0069930 [Thermochaetoides thermophila DSM 1495]EGS17653.1 hypothetical protein CTHT_0069930 [Thermochaetoides thermophila DSM 1495]